MISRAVQISTVIAATCVMSADAATDKKLLWGDTHLHTAYSPDAYLSQNFSAKPDIAYRFAMGYPVIHPSTRTRVQIETPLDFLVISDHAESMGVFKAAAEGNIPRGELGVVDSGIAWLAEKGMAFLAGNPENINYFMEYATAETTDVVESAKIPPSLPIPGSDVIRGDTWQASIEAADINNQPGAFSAFIGWEWSSIPAGANLHRVVFTPADASVAQQWIPFASSESNYPEDLWRWLDDVSGKTGAEFISIPHNSNISRGYMFPEQRNLRDEPITPEWSELRARYENVVEITQVKGDSETHPSLSPDDPFADFEPFPHYLKPGVGSYKASKGDFVRPALLTGLSIAEDSGVNPYKFGLIGSTDSHTSLATAEENNFWGKMATDAKPEDKATANGHIEKLGWAMSASGLAAVWSEENTRASIFAAFKRREVYATTGPRIAVRVYAGADFVEADLDTPDFAAIAARGVPMGGELSALQSAPSFLVHAAKDPISAHLDRIQMVKGWLEKGQPRERIFDIAWSGARDRDSAGNITAVANTVDLKTGHYSNEHGAEMLSAVWSDPDFDAEQAAFYYVRVLELPTPRHSTLDAIALNIPAADTGQATTLQERAYTSPIFYTPESSEK